MKQNDRRKNLPRNLLFKTLEEYIAEISSYSEEPEEWYIGI